MRKAGKMMRGTNAHGGTTRAMRRGVVVGKDSREWQLDGNGKTRVCN